MGATSTVAAALLLVCLCGLHTTEAQDCPIDTNYCGPFCCPNTVDTTLTECCVDSLSCCRPDTQNNTARPSCGESRSVQQCPLNLPPSEVYDGDNQLRNNCCKYFREGCCSLEENRFLDILFKVSIGIGVAVFILLVIIIALLAYCMSVFCCS